MHCNSNEGLAPYLLTIKKKQQMKTKQNYIFYVEDIVTGEKIEEKFFEKLKDAREYCNSMYYNTRDYFPVIQRLQGNKNNLVYCYR